LVNFPARDRTGDNLGKPQHAVVRNKDRLVDAHRFAAGALQAGGEPGVLIDDDVGHRHQTPHHLGRPLGIRHQCTEHQPLAVFAIAGVWPGAGELNAAGHDLDLFARIVGAGDQIVGVAPNILLAFEREECRHPLIAHGQRAAPTGTAARRPELEGNLRQFGETVFEAAEARRPDELGQLGIAQMLHRFFRHAPIGLGIAGGVAEDRFQGAHAVEQNGEIGPCRLRGKRHSLGSHSLGSHSLGQLHAFLHRFICFRPQARTAFGH
jgi:hypothetical protein